MVKGLSFASAGVTSGSPPTVSAAAAYYEQACGWIRDMDKAHKLATKACDLADADGCGLAGKIDAGEAKKYDRALYSSAEAATR